MKVALVYRRCRVWVPNANRLMLGRRMPDHRRKAQEWQKFRSRLTMTSLNLYLYYPESKFADPDGKPCDPWTRGVLQRGHIVAERHIPCGKEFERKLDQGPVDHELDVSCKVYETGRVAADPETLSAAKAVLRTRD